MSDKIPYLRVGTTYYKTIEKPLISGDKISILVRWNRETLRRAEARLRSGSDRRARPGGRARPRRSHRASPPDRTASGRWRPRVWCPLEP